MFPNGTSSSSSPTAYLRADEGEIKVVTREKPSDPTVVDTPSSAELLSELTVTDDRAKPVSSDWARPQASAIAAAAVTAMATLDDSVNRAYIKPTLNGEARVYVYRFAQLHPRRTARNNSHIHRLNLNCSIFSSAATTVVQWACDHPHPYPVKSTYPITR